MDFWDFVDQIAEEYGVAPLGIGPLGMGHGVYTGGETQVPRTKADLEGEFRTLTEANLDSYIDEAREESNAERWGSLMRLAVGKVIIYEWERRRNGLEEDRSLRGYLEALRGLKPEN